MLKLSTIKFMLKLSAIQLKSLLLELFMLKLSTIKFMLKLSTIQLKSLLLEQYTDISILLL